MTVESSTTLNLPKTLPTFITLHIRLDRSNFTYWRSQVLATVRAHGYSDVLFCISIPPPDSPDPEDPHGAIHSWHRRDQHLLSWLFSSISDSMLGHVNRCSHSCEVWQIFEDLFRLKSQAQVMNLRFQLQTVKKSDSSVDEFILKIRTKMG